MSAEALSDYTALYEDVMLLKNPYWTDTTSFDDLPPSASMDSGDNCRILWKIQKQVSTEFPFLTGDSHGFMPIRNLEL